jgi:hypothetical protein
VGHTKSCDGAAAMGHIVWATLMCGRRCDVSPSVVFIASVRYIEGMWQIV